ncbi:hypothetical protein [uncultured Tateyamaria sp.]|uniref:hypothetical protein n=1 Tax=Tateyamaria sp. 1078 TaxID=3417464 RepID=UPI002617B75B|nr:hypothetical protein [uncultured Tateyamaria sp.]
MMNVASLYQDFGTEISMDGPVSNVSTDKFEDEKLQAFENGYQAGWDDSTKAQTTLELTISSALAANLQDASFQYHELRSQLTRTVRDIMQGVVDTVLPDMARQSLGAHIVQLIEARTRDALVHTIQLRVPEASLDHVERILPESPISYELVADATLAPDQASLQLDDTEHVIDLGRVVADVGAAVAEYFETQNSEGQDDRTT